jgi:NADH-quinone oxidoreductase subunit E
MIMLVLQTLFFMAIAFVAGCFFGCWLKRRVDSGTVEHSAASSMSPDAKSGGASGVPGSSPAPGPSSSAPAEPTGSASATQPDAAPPVAAAATAPVAKAQDSAQSEPAAPKEPKPKAKTAKPKSTAKGASAEATSKKASPAKKATTKAATPKSATSSKAKPAAAEAKSGSGKKPAAAAGPDDLKKIKGVGPQLEAKLNAIGVTSFAQIAKWTKKQQADFSEQLSFPGRIERDDWVAQAKVLAKGEDTEFSKRVAKGDVASSKGSAGGGAGGKSGT